MQQVDEIGILLAEHLCQLTCASVEKRLVTVVLNTQMYVDLEFQVTR